MIGKRSLPLLRSLVIGDFVPDEAVLNWTDAGNLEPLYKAVPALEHLTLRAGGDQLYLVALTGYDGSDARAKVKEAGFNNLHLTKPVDVSELAKLLSHSRA